MKKYLLIVYVFMYSLNSFSQGKEVYTVLNNEQKDYRKYIYPINLDELNLDSGTYYCK
ncbi:MAG: hypothetical protein HN507_02180 [Flavobacteriaceae bacterium]|jgi:hypothetical protein|nr:hypothetical protein [Flavobacteriaceae bacterium]